MRELAARCPNGECVRAHRDEWERGREARSVRAAACFVDMNTTNTSRCPCSSRAVSIPRIHEMATTRCAALLLLCAPAQSMRLHVRGSTFTSSSGPSPAGGAARIRMSAAPVACDAASIEEAVSLFGRLSDSQHVFTTPIRTEASGFEFSSNTAIKPKWLIAYVSRDPCGEDVDLPTHRTRWSSLLFPSDVRMCSRETFDRVMSEAEYEAPLGIPKWAASNVLVDTKACAAPPSLAARDALWTALGGKDELACEVVIANLRAMATSDELHEAVLFSEFRSGLQSCATSP